MITPSNDQTHVQGSANNKSSAREKMMKWSKTPKVKANTSDEKFNKIINDIILKQGKDIAIQYLQGIKATMLQQKSPTAHQKPSTDKLLQPRRGLKLKASDGNIYTLSIGNNPNDLLWQDESGAEAKKRIDKELMAKIQTSESINKSSKYEIYEGDILDLLETSSGGATSAGGIASVANPIGQTISRTPNLFGYIPDQPKNPKKRKFKRKSAQ